MLIHADPPPPPQKKANTFRPMNLSKAPILGAA